MLKEMAGAVLIIAILFTPIAEAKRNPNPQARAAQKTAKARKRAMERQTKEIRKQQKLQTGHRR